ncbi:MAG: Tat pathway signal protein, partial [Sutterellaceae bacterium]|nr:Tat pathway signal protein [Sutterellaceae bacterium]
WQGSDKVTTAESMSDAVKAALAAKQGRWAFVQVMCAHTPDDECANAKDLGDIAIFASFDPVALDQLACDIAYGSAPDAATRARWEDYHSAFLPETASKNGVGRNTYRLVEI